MEKNIIDKWKEANIHHAVFQFSCGGDSMNETSLTFHNEDGDLISEGVSELESYFNDEVYRQVNFYEASDGHYMGESGNVAIELDDDAFVYSKSSQSEWCERITQTFDCPLTQDEFDLFDKYIANMRYVSWDGRGVDYKTDFILTNEFEAKIQALHEKFYDLAENKVEYEGGGDVNEDGYEYSTTDFDNEDQTPEFLMIDGVHHIKVHCTIEVYEYRDDED